MTRFDEQQFVDLPTGAAQFSVPLPAISSGALHLPMSLQYSYRGLKVYQPVDLVGLGWSLQAGASISVQVEGLLDNQTTAQQRYSPTDIDKWLNSFHHDYFKLAYNHLVDTGPDIYTFNVPGGPTGHFYLRDTTVVMFPAQPVHVERLGPRNGFLISTEDGTRYYYQTTEHTHAHADNFFGLGTYESAWHLTRVISADNADTLRLNYTSHSVGSPTRCVTTTARVYIGQGGAGCTSVNIRPDVHNVYAKSSPIKAQYLESVVGRGATLVLQRDSSGVLQKVQLFSTLAPQRLVQQMELFQSSFAGTSGLSNARLRLDSVRQAVGTLRLPAYRFAYNDSVAMPSRGSTAQDYWGYYNGAVSNGSLNYPSLPALLDNPILLGTLSANRAPDYDYAAAGAIKRATLPTGGSVAWRFEPGTFYGTPEEQHSRRDSVDVTIENGFDSAHSYSLMLPGATRPIQVTDAAEQFHLYRPTDLMVTLARATNGNNTNGTNNGVDNRYKDFDILKKLPGGDSLVTTSGVPRAYKAFDTQPVAHFLFTLPAGEYVVQVHCESNPNGDELNTMLHLRYPRVDTLTTDALIAPGPGIRVRQTVTTTPQAPPLVRTYEYGATDSTGVSNSSSGTFIWGASTTQHALNEYSYDCTAFYNVLQTDQTPPGASLNQRDFYYEYVTETLGSDAGLTVHRFTPLELQFNEVVPAERWTYRASENQPARRALVKKERFAYTYQGAVYLPILSTGPSMTASSTAIFLPDSTAIAHSAEDFWAEKTTIAAAFQPLVNTETTLFDAQGRALRTTTRSHYQDQRLVRTATSTSTGWDIQRFKYLGDFGPLAEAAALRVYNFNPVVETQRWHRSPAGDSALLGGHLTRFDPQWRKPRQSYRLQLDRPAVGLNRDAQTAGHVDEWLLDKRYLLDGTVAYDPATGQVQQAKQRAGTPTAYVWGYNQTELIAQVTAATAAQVAYTGFEAQETGRWARLVPTAQPSPAAAYTGTASYDLGAGGLRCAGVPAGTYTVSGWVKAGTGVPMTNGAALTPVGPVCQGWQQYGLTVALAAAGTVDVAGTGLLDELRLHPVGAQMTTYTHVPLVGLASQTDPSGRTTTYEYDGLGRLVRTRDEQGRVLSQQQYHYARH